MTSNYDITQILGGGRGKGKGKREKKNDKKEKKHASERNHSWSREKREQAEGQVHQFPHPGHPSWNIDLGNGEVLESKIGFVESIAGHDLMVRTMRGALVRARIRKGKVCGKKVDYDKWNEHITKCPLAKIPVPSESIVVVIQQVFGGWAVVYVYTHDEIDIMTDAEIFDALYTSEDDVDDEFAEFFDYERDETVPPTVEELLIAKLAPKVSRGSYEEDIMRLVKSVVEEESEMCDPMEKDVDPVEQCLMMGLVAH
uniref:Uncharacterized protein n=1 Tax=viral metagenome TaxID=1070528 RepID=A0A6C0DAF3_9ZZZZ